MSEEWPRMDHKHLLFAIYDIMKIMMTKNDEVNGMKQIREIIRLAFCGYFGYEKEKLFFEDEV